MTITRFNDEYRFLSNFWPVKVTMEGLEYPTVEHAYQAAKTLNPDLRWAITRITSPSAAKSAGKNLPLRPDWDRVKLQVMYELLSKKFVQEPLRTQLLETDTQELVEGNYHHDMFWGVCLCDRHGRGENNLGILLMKFREALLATPIEP